MRPGNGYKIPNSMTLTQKGDVNGVFTTQLFKSLKTACGGADVGWNFEAFLVGKDGVPVTRWTTGAAGGPTGFIADIAKLFA